MTDGDLAKYKEWKALEADIDGIKAEAGKAIALYDQYKQQRADAFEKLFGVTIETGVHHLSNPGDGAAVSGVEPGSITIDVAEGGTITAIHPDIFNPYTLKAITDDGSLYSSYNVALNDYAAKTVDLYNSLESAIGGVSGHASLEQAFTTAGSILAYQSGIERARILASGLAEHQQLLIEEFIAEAEKKKDPAGTGALASSLGAYKNSLATANNSITALKAASDKFKDVQAAYGSLAGGLTEKQQTLNNAIKQLASDYNLVVARMEALDTELGNKVTGYPAEADIHQILKTLKPLLTADRYNSVATKKAVDDALEAMLGVVPVHLGESATDVAKKARGLASDELALAEGRLNSAMKVLTQTNKQLSSASGPVATLRSLAGKLSDYERGMGVSAIEQYKAARAELARKQAAMDTASNTLFGDIFGSTPAVSGYLTAYGVAVNPLDGSVPTAGEKQQAFNTLISGVKGLVYGNSASQAAGDITKSLSIGGIAGKHLDGVISAGEVQARRAEYLGGLAALTTANAGQIK